MQEILVDCEHLIATPCTMLGQWTLAQIIKHLAQGVDCFYDGFDFTVPWYARSLLAPLVRRRMLTRGLPAGVRVPASARRLLPQEGPELASAMNHLRAAISRLQTDAPRHPHPFFGQMNHSDAKLLMLRHSELHLSFAVPNP
jgi:hypothetical protein